MLDLKKKQKCQFFLVQTFVYTRFVAKYGRQPTYVKRQLKYFKTQKNLNGFNNIL